MCNFIAESLIFRCKGVLFVSARQATLVVLHCTPKISFINFRCTSSKGSESLNLLPTPQTSLPYRMMGTTRESKSFSRRLHGLFRVIVFLILNHAFLPFSH